MRTEILNRIAQPIFVLDSESPLTSLRDAVELAVKRRVLLLGANLGGANLRGANLGGANLGGANLRDADLRGANLLGANLRDADLGGADLRGANLRDADLGGADLLDADLRGANLLGANLGGANLLDANLRGANLRDADLGGADLRDANLLDANLGGANLGGATLPTGETLDNYMRDVVPVLLTSQGIPLSAQTVEVWGCHEWSNCPTTVAGVGKNCPPLLRPRRDQFVQLFDAGLIQRPTTWGSLAQPTPTVAVPPWVRTW